jgi:predicted PurR-regulated permease PerM
MSDPGTIQWETIKDIISSVGVMIAILISVIGLVRSSKQKQNDQLTNIEKTLNAHILEDEHSITELQTNVKNLTDNVNNKLDTIIRELDK